MALLFPHLHLAYQASEDLFAVTEATICVPVLLLDRMKTLTALGLLRSLDRRFVSIQPRIE